MYDIVAKIPFGRVTSYGAIAKVIGSSKSSRLVGYAMNHCHLTHPDLCAHRVVNRNGVLTGKFHFGTEDKMQVLLENEGHTINNNTIKDFKNVFWDPELELI